jgi:hypothetical protein
MEKAKTFFLSNSKRQVCSIHVPGFIQAKKQPNSNYFYLMKLTVEGGKKE